ncbi:hypothetical protein XaC1_212 [Xanthomonas phage XaC1]|nr:hypothetical protein XaC1_212 [Xanthomonas phage XaC1]
MTNMLTYIKDKSNNHKIMYFSDYNNEDLKFRAEANIKPCKVQFFAAEELEGYGIPKYFTDLVMVFLDKKGNPSKKYKIHYHMTSAIFDTSAEAAEHYNNCIDQFVELMNTKCNEFNTKLLNSKIKVK